MPNEHDKRYKKLFSHPLLVKELILYFVKEDFVKELDFTDMERLDKSFITDDFKEKESDIIWKINFKENNIFIYLLIEFQSTVDRFMALRMNRYINEFYEFLSCQVKRELLPAVFPVLLYNGDEKWTACSSLEDLIAPAIPGKYIPKFTYYKIIENEIPGRILLRIKNTVSAIFYVENCEPEKFSQEIKNVLQLLEKEKPELIQLFRIWLNNLFSTTKKEYTAGKINNQLEELVEVKNMFSTKLEKYGKNLEEKAEKKAKEETAVKMLKKGYDLDEISDITGLTKEEIEKLK